MAFQALYSWDVHYSQTGDTSIPADLLEFSWTRKTGDEGSALDEEMAAFSRLLLTGTIENINAVDAMIRKYLVNWEFGRLNKVDLAVLRMSVYSLMFQTEMPATVIIDEAIGISKEFGADDSYRFVNGILDTIYKNLSGN